MLQVLALSTTGEALFRRALHYHRIPLDDRAFAEAVVAGDGTIWMRQSAVPGTSVEYLVLGRDGIGAETIAAPKAESIVEALGSRVWTKSVDDDGTVVIRVYTLESKSTLPKLEKRDTLPT